jgi:hypothetical protein
MRYTNELPAEPPPVSASAPAVPATFWRSRELLSTLAFVSMPVLVFLAATYLDTDVPGAVFYALVLLLVPMMLWRVLRDPEWVMAAFILYIPLAKSYVLPVAPGINATNVLMGAMILAWIARARREGRPMFASMPMTGAVWAWAVLSTLSFITAIFTRGIDEFLDLRVGMIRVWLDQFIVFFAFINLIRDGAMARRIAVYLCLGSFVVVFCGFSEWLIKGDAGSIEKSRLLGPQRQPNDLAAFIAYSTGPFVAFFVEYMPRLRAALMLPYLVVVLRVLLGAFSRGGYIAYGVEGLLAMSLRGKLLLAAVLGAAAIVVTSFPELLPQSVVARMSETKSESGEGLDKSSETRLILWRAALKMTAESPVFGKGFFTFPFLKGDYTEIEVMESDNHNMYLYIASQMGVPALIALIVAIARLYVLSRRVYRRADDGWAKVLGLGTAAMCGGVAAVNMFGSRMLDVSVVSYVWIYAAVISHLWTEIEARQAPPPAGDDRFVTRRV